MASKVGFSMRNVSLVLGALYIFFIALPVLASSGERPRVIVSTDIGGTDPDDQQSLVHLLLYADSLELEGLISSPFGPGRKQDILDVIALYQKDYPNLVKHTPLYPTPDYLHSITKQGETKVAPFQGVRQSTEGSQWIIKRARMVDERPLNILIWGGLEDLAQALHDAPDILPKLRVYYIGGPNKKWSPDAYQYIASKHPSLWIIETNASYRGWFEGGNQKGEWGNQAFVSRHVAGKGALGNYFTTLLDGTIKMGDSPSVAWVLSADSGNPAKPSWGGRFVKAWARPYKKFSRLTTDKDSVEEFSIVEWVLPLSNDPPHKPEIKMLVENQSLIGFVDKKNRVHFRFSPKAAKVFQYKIESNDLSLHGKAGAIKALPSVAEMAFRPDDHWPNWWVDDPAPKLAEGPHIGAKTVSRWRQEFLQDFVYRLQRLQSIAPKATNKTGGND